MTASRNRKGRAPRRRGAFGTSVRLGALFAALVGVNVYVFLLRGDTSLRAVMRQGALPAQLRRGAAVQAPPPSAAASAASREEARIVEGVVGAGESFRKILERIEVPRAHAEALIAALGRELDFKSLRAGVRWRFELDAADGRPIFGELRLSPIETIAVKATAGGYDVQRLREELETRTVVFGGVIERSLYDSIEAAGESTSIIPEFVDVFAWDLDFYTDQHPGDRFKVVAEKRFRDGAFYGYGRVLAAEYAGKAGTFRAFWHESEGRGGYYDEKGQSAERTILRTPLKYVRVTSRFGTRFHPILHRTKGHMGVDLAAPEGTPVRATASGRVSFAGRQGGSGNLIVLRHDNGLTSLYMHLSRFAKGLHDGQRVEQRQVIGYVGMTGLATGPHLHFGLKKNGSYIDPMRVRGDRGKALAGAALAAFKSEAGARIATLAAVDPEPPQRQAARGLSAHR